MSNGTLELRFSADHCWARMGPDGRVTVGLTDFAQAALGAIQFAGLPEIGANLDEGDAFGEVESTKAVSELYAPVAGTVTAANAPLTDAPGAINVDPYGAGWICVLAPSDPTAFGRLLDREAYAKLTDIEPETEPSTKD